MKKYPYAYEYGKRWNVKTPRWSIRWLVDRQHVSATLEEIDALIASKLEGTGPESPAIKAQCFRYARLVHESNVSLYRCAMGSSF